MASAGPQQSGFDPMSLAPLVLIFVAMYFLVMRPAQKKQKEQKSMLNSLRRGDEVLLNGGIVGNISKVVNDLEVMVEISKGVNVRVARAMIAQKMSATDLQPSNVESINSKKSTDKNKKRSK
jgi:preprotein translocase subunit YajC